MANVLMNGIDISACQQKVDFKKLKESGYSFVIIRAGFGKYTKQKDIMFESHYKGAKDAGLHIGVYWYSYALSEADARAEAEVCNTIISGKKFDFPVFYDIEEQSTFAKGAKTVDAIANTFCNTMENYGWFCGIYGGQSLAENYLSQTTRNRFAFWYAAYLKQPRYTGQYGIWQNGVAGDVISNNPNNVKAVPGVVGKCDMDVDYVDYPTIIKNKKLNGYQDDVKPEPTPEPAPAPKDEFVPRLTIPEKGNPYYNTISNGGYSTAIVGKPTYNGLNVLANCVGYAFGRYNEIAGENACKYLQPVNAEDFVDVARSQGLTVSNTPSLGAIICWAKGKTHTSSDGCGHVAVVEIINDDGSIVTSESGYNCSTPFWTQKRVKGNGNWGAGSDYTFLGFIENPKKSKPEKKENRAPYKEPTKPVRENDTGDDVRWLQWYLKDLKYFNDDISGVFDIYTLGALLAFQFKNGLEMDGVCGPATRYALINA